MKEFFKKNKLVLIIAAAVLLAVAATVILLWTLRGDPFSDGSSAQEAPSVSDTLPTTPANQVLGTSDKNLSKDQVRRLVAELYYKAGVEKWGDRYAIALGGGYIPNPGADFLAAGTVTYGDLRTLLPSNDRLVLCSVKGMELSTQFFYSSNANYFVSYGDYGASIKERLNTINTYYIVTDMATAKDPANKLTVVEEYPDGIYARDLLAQYIQGGGLGQPAPTTQPTAGNNPSGSGEGGGSVTTPGGNGGAVQGGTTAPGGCKQHTDANSDELCDVCRRSVIVTFDFYSINDLHGKFADASGHIGVDELSTYLLNARYADENAVFLSAGDMWQGSPESNLTYGNIITDWMNELDFTAAAVGNHDYDWGESYLEKNAQMADFPFLAINIYDRDTNARVSYCDASVMLDRGGVQVGIIGAIGDCYSSISADKVNDVYFKVGSDLTALVKAESDRLRAAGADFIVYIIHDGYGKSQSGSASSSQLKSYYDMSLSDGYVDLVFEGHTHQGYVLQDTHGVYHLQNRGDNKGGISHADVAINSVTLKAEVREAKLVYTAIYQSLDDHPVVNNLLNKYKDIISKADQALGNNRSTRNSTAICNKVAELYYQLGVDTWGKEYKIVLGGGFLNTRSPYNLYAGPVKYGDLQMVLPFDNQIVLCSIKGKYLSSKFFNTSNSDYYIYYGDYGASVKNSIDPNATYYVVVDSYTSQYGPNHLTVVKEYDPTVFARDLLADYIAAGGWE